MNHSSQPGLNAPVTPQPSTDDYRQLIESFAQAVWEANPAGQIVDDSPSWRAYTGQTIDQWLGEGWANAVHPHQRPAVLAQWRQAVADHQPVQAEYQLQHAKGGWRWTSVRATPVFEPDGSVRKWIGLNVDITERKLAEEALRQSEQRLAQAIDIGGIGHWALNLATQELTTSAHCRGNFGRSQDLPFSYQELVASIHPADRERQQRVVEEAIHQQADFQVEYRIVTAHDEIWWVHIQGRYEPGRLVGVSMNTTQRKRAEEALRTSNIYLNAVLDVLPVGLAIADASGTILRYNDALRRIWGVPLILDSTVDYTDWKGRFVDSGQTLAAEDWAMTRTLTTGEPVAGDIVEIERFDGRQATILNAAAPIKDEQGQVIGGVVAELDITVQRQAEDALRAADRRKDEFLAMLAHELRNPLATLSSGLDILSTAPNEEVNRFTMTMLNRQMTHLIRLVDDLLDVSRINRGAIHLQTQRVDLVDLVDQAVDSVRTLFAQQGKTLHWDRPTGGIELEGDLTRLSQVVVNLLTNGVRYTGESGLVWVSLEQKQTEAILRVRDNGIGLAADQLSGIFDLFVQVDNSLARSKGGLGLGLTLVKQLVHMHGGRIQAQSAGLGQGSTFTICLPTSSAMLYDQPRTMELTGEQATSQCILIVDDNPDATLTLGMLLELKGYQVHTRNSGQSGIEAAEQLRPGVILLDIGMPELDGYATCRLLRQQPWSQDMAIIALTGYGQPEDRQRTQQAGFTAHLTKPVNLGVLTKLLTDWLS